MTSLTWAELDRLADYAAGLLTDVDAAEVDELVRTDARWAQAHEALVAAAPTVRSQLAFAGRQVEPMPDDVWSRLEDALAAAPAVFPPPAPVPAPRRRSSAAAEARRRWSARSALAGLATAAAAVVAVAGGAVLVGQSALENSVPGMTAEDAGEPGPAAAPTFAVPGVDSSKDDGRVIMATGTDYRLETLPQLATVPMAGAESTRVAEGPPSQELSAPLSALTDAATLERCVAAVVTAHPGVVTIIDYASYAGQPALVMVVQQSNGSTVVAVGPGCGASGPDQLASTFIE